MKKLFPLLILMVFMTGCLGISKTSGKISGEVLKTVDPVVDPVADHVTAAGLRLENLFGDVTGLAGKTLEQLLKPSFGYTYMLIAIELNSNISSLVIDKTKEKIVGYQSDVTQKLTPGNFLFVIPPKISNGETSVYDDEMGRMLRNFLAVGQYGIPVSNPADAEYIVVTNIRESLSKTYGLNYSEISFSIMNKLDIPVYLATVRVESSSDRNFWYHATKKARPVKQLTMKGMTHILAEGLPEAHGSINTFVSSVQKFVSKDKEEN